MSTLSPDQLDAIRHMSEGELITLHFGLGMYIRNGFGLWQRNDDLLESCCSEIDDPWLRRIVMHEPDKASEVIVKALWERLQSPE